MLTSLYPRWPRWGVWNGEIPPPEGGPVNTSPPVVTGSQGQSPTANIGDILTCTDNGTWDNNPTEFAYHWMRGTTYLDASFNLPEYTVTSDDIGFDICCEVTAINNIAPCLKEACSNVFTVAGGKTPEEPRKSEF